MLPKKPCSGVARRHFQFPGRASPRTWLYRIATNVCLRTLERRAIARRLMPDSLAASVPFAPLGDADHDTPWLEPYPDAIVEDRS